MRRPALAILALSGPVAALLSSSVATQRGHDSGMVPQGEPTRVPDGAPSERRVSGGKIPSQLVLTAKEGGLDDLPRKQRANVEKTLALNPDLEVRFLNDAMCGEFIDRNFGGELAYAFKHETVGYFRGDMCRAAVMAIEGGFYADLDVQFRVPFSEMVDSETTFMSAFDSYCNLWNAILAAEPNSIVLLAVIDSMKTWYNQSLDAPGPAHRGKLMGTHTFYEGLNKVVKRDCTNKCRGSSCADLHFKARRKLQFQCGKDNKYRLYRELPLDCGQWDSKGRDQEECPDSRVNGFWGMRMGIFEPGASGAGSRGKLVAWSRFEDCSFFGCNERRSAPPPSNGTDSRRMMPEQRPVSHCP